MENLASLSVGQILEKGAAQVPDKVAVVDGEQRTTYGELNMMADALAATKGHRPVNDSYSVTPRL